MGMTDGLWKREEDLHWTKQKDADFWVSIWELLLECAEKNLHLDVKHVKGSRTGERHMYTDTLS